jgi:hypothetical protein
MIDRESDCRFIASIPDLDDSAAHGYTDKDAVVHVTALAGRRVRAAVEAGQPVPPRRQRSNMPSQLRRSAEASPVTIPVDVGRREAQPTPPYYLIACARRQQWEHPHPRKAGRPQPIEVRGGMLEVVGVHYRTSLPPTCAPAP